MAKSSLINVLCINASSNVLTHSWEISLTSSRYKKCEYAFLCPSDLLGNKQSCCERWLRTAYKCDGSHGC